MACTIPNKMFSKGAAHVKLPEEQTDLILYGSFLLNFGLLKLQWDVNVYHIATVNILKIGTYKNHSR